MNAQPTHATVKDMRAAEERRRKKEEAEEATAVSTNPPVRFA
jgi:hypothetical protein